MISVYFLHCGKGQSIAIRLPPNHWIVVDADWVGGMNPCLELLKRYEDEDDFRVLAVVISHFHQDHYRGLPSIIERYIEQGKLDTIVTPALYQTFYALLLAAPEGPTKGPLKRLCQLLAQHREKVDHLQVPSFAWGNAETEKPWFFAHWPESEWTMEKFVKMQLFKEGKPTGLKEAYRRLATQANEFSYLLATGWGKKVGDLHLLLPADVAKTSFARFRKRLLENWLPAVAEKRFGAPQALRELMIEYNGETRLRPVQVLGVPHHGSDRDRISTTGLQWWSGREMTTAQPIAVVQGDAQALGKRTLENLLQAGFDVYASSLPGFFHNGGSTGLHEDGLPSIFIPSAPKGLRYLAVHGGAAGIENVDPVYFYRLLSTDGKYELLTPETST